MNWEIWAEKVEKRHNNKDMKCILKIEILEGVSDLSKYN